MYLYSGRFGLSLRFPFCAAVPRLLNVTVLRVQREQPVSQVRVAAMLCDLPSKLCHFGRDDSQHFRDRFAWIF